jgi:pyruvate-formate lyase-activating enzyme
MALLPGNLNELQFQPAHPLLPVFSARMGGLVLFYAPTYLAVARADQGAALVERLGAQLPPANGVERELAAAAHSAITLLEEQRKQAFEPVCLTLYPSERCNLACAYCFAEEDHRRGGRLSPAAALAGARLVAEICRKRGLPLVIGMHGGGEPGLEPGLVDLVLDEVERWGLPLYRYIATNGVLSRERARWVARRFDAIGLSCDGPADIQNRQRPRQSGGPSSAAVEQMARLVHAAGKQLTVRVTLTEQSVGQMAEIAQYVCEQLAPREIHLEAAYLGGRAGAELALNGETAERFIEGFWQGWQTARAHGVRWVHSAARLWEVHGAYCNPLRGVLQLVPGDAASACFKTAHDLSARAAGTRLGRFDPLAQEWVFEPGEVDSWKERTGVIPDGCVECFLAYNCTHNCANRCLLQGWNGELGAFCRVERSLAAGWLARFAAELAGPAEQAGLAGMKLSPEQF